MRRDEAEELLGLATELEHRALSHEKNIRHLDLTEARRLRDLVGRLRFVVAAAECGSEGDALRREVLGLRLEAMAVLLAEPSSAPPISSAAGGDVIPIGRIRRR